MAFLKKLRALFQKIFPRPRRRRKLPARKSKKKIIRKSALRRSSKIKKSSGQKSRNFKSPPIGEITHFFPRIQVCVLKVSGSGIKVGDQILIVGKERRFAQKVMSLQIESIDVKSAKRGSLVGLKLDKPAEVGYRVFKI